MLMRKVTGHWWLRWVRGLAQSAESRPILTHTHTHTHTHVVMHPIKVHWPPSGRERTVRLRGWATNRFCFSLFTQVFPWSHVNPRATNHLGQRPNDFKLGIEFLCRMLRPGLKMRRPRSIISIHDGHYVSWKQIPRIVMKRKKEVQSPKGVCFVFKMCLGVSLSICSAVLEGIEWNILQCHEHLKLTHAYYHAGSDLPNSSSYPLCQPSLRGPTMSFFWAGPVSSPFSGSQARPSLAGAQ